MLSGYEFGKYEEMFNAAPQKVVLTGGPAQMECVVKAMRDMIEVCLIALWKTFQKHKKWRTDGKKIEEPRMVNVPLKAFM